MSHSALQQGAYDRLTAQIGGSVVGVYTDVPPYDEAEDDAAYPFVTIGPFVALPFDTKEAVGETVIMRVSIWTRTHDNLARAALRDAVKAALNRYEIPITGHEYSDCLFEGAEGFDDPDGKTRQMVMRFRVTFH